MSEKTSLTDPPTNLKEAIDWVIRISELQKINDISEALEKLLKEDAGLVMWEVRDVFDVIKNNIIDQFGKMHGFGPQHYKNCLSSATENLGTLERPDNLKSVNLKTVIRNLAEGLKKFLGYNGGGSTNFNGNGIIGSNGGSYDFSYNTATWIRDDAPKCAAIFLGILPVIFFGVTLTYWKCSEKNGWHDKTLTNESTQSRLSFFLTQMGYKDTMLNHGKKASDVVGYVKSGFNELSQGNASSKSYPEFLSELHKMPLNSSLPNSSSPLTSLYLLSYYYITYPLYIVEPTNPATPSFAGYSGVAALAGGAYGFNLGGIGTFMSALLV